MLISTIEFEIHNAAKGIHEEFVIENTVLNQEKVFAHHYTRGITFSQMFDFEFSHKCNIPAEFIQFSTELENELDETDEMVGIFV